MEQNIGTTGFDHLFLGGTGTPIVEDKTIPSQSSPKSALEHLWTSSETDSEVLMMNFGKYRGKEVDFVIQNDVEYCKWALSQPFIDDDIKQMIAQKVDINDYYLRWGKYKGKSILWVKKKDPQYINWLKKNEFVQTKCPKLLICIKNI